jgi:hypothetical protein
MSAKGKVVPVVEADRNCPFALPRAARRGRDGGCRSTRPIAAAAATSARRIRRRSPARRRSGRCRHPPAYPRSLPEADGRRSTSPRMIPTARRSATSCHGPRSCSPLPPRARRQRRGRLCPPSAPTRERPPPWRERPAPASAPASAGSSAGSSTRCSRRASGSPSASGGGSVRCSSASP